MHGNNRPAQIDERNLALAGEPYEPGIPSITANQERRHLSVVQITRKAEIIHPARPVQSPFHRGNRPQPLIPPRLIEVPRLGDIRVPAPSNHEERVVGFGGHLECCAEIRSQHYVAVRIAQDVMAGDLLGAIKNVIEVLRAMLIPGYMRLMADPKISANLSCPFFISEEDNLNVRVQ